MKKSILLLVFVFALLTFTGCSSQIEQEDDSLETGDVNVETGDDAAEDVEDSEDVEDEDSQDAEDAEDVEDSDDSEDVEDSKVQEFSMDSFTEIKDGKYFPAYSIKKITVKKGDKVKIKIKTTSGIHDFNIDEFNVKAETPLDEEVVVEFTADKAGEFIYYCSKPGHRENGHWGTLIVTE